MLRRYQCEELPITPTIVDRVHDMASCDRQVGGLAFHDRTGTLLKQVDPKTFDTLTSSHGTTALNRPLLRWRATSHPHPLAARATCRPSRRITSARLTLGTM